MAMRQRTQPLAARQLPRRCRWRRRLMSWRRGEAQRLWAWGGCLPTPRPPRRGKPCVGRRFATTNGGSRFLCLLCGAQVRLLNRGNATLQVATNRRPTTSSAARSQVRKRVRATYSRRTARAASEREATAAQSVQTRTLPAGRVTTMPTGSIVATSRNTTAQQQQQTWRRITPTMCWSKPKPLKEIAAGEPTRSCTPGEPAQERNNLGTCWR